MIAIFCCRPFTDTQPPIFRSHLPPVRFRIFVAQKGREAKVRFREIDRHLVPFPVNQIVRSDCGVYQMPVGPEPGGESTVQDFADVITNMASAIFCLSFCFQNIRTTADCASCAPVLQF